MSKRLDPNVRADALLQTALRVAEVKGWRAMTRECIAVAAGVSPGLVSARLGTMAAVRRQVMRAAVRQRVITVVAEGLLFGDAHARRADAELRQAAAEHVCR